VGPEPWKPLFLAALAERLSAEQACLVAGVGRTTAYMHRRSDPEFGERWKALWETCVDDLEQSLFSRAKDGWEEPVFYQGKECGRIRKFDHRLGEFFIQKWRPDRYGDRASPLDPNDVAARIRELQRAARAQESAEPQEGTDAQGDG
jgi:hypothetical protein